MSMSISITRAFERLCTLSSPVCSGYPDSTEVSARRHHLKSAFVGSRSELWPFDGTARRGSSESSGCLIVSPRS